MISEDEVKHIAKLARLELTGKEVEKMQKDLSNILDYFNLLKKAPMPERANKDLIKGPNKVRKDEVKPRDAIMVQKIIAGAPDKKDDYIKVKTIL